MLTARVTYDKSVNSYDVEYSTRGSGDWDTLKAINTIIKSSISASNRMYDPVTKHWSFTEQPFRDIVEKLFISMKVQYSIEDAVVTVGPENFFYEHAVSGQVADTPEILSARLMKMLELTEEQMLDASIVKKAYRREAMRLHPDRNNGDGSGMSALNEVWNAYTKN